MSLIDMKQLGCLRLDRINPGASASDTSSIGGPSEGLGVRRSRACDAVVAELSTGRSSLEEPAAAFHSYGDGYLAVGVAGSVDRAMVRRVAGLLRDLRPYSLIELLITFALLGSWHPHLVRVIGQARIRHLIGGGRVELRGAPPGLAAALSSLPSDPTLDRNNPVARRDREPCLEQWGLLL